MTDDERWIAGQLAALATDPRYAGMVLVSSTGAVVARQPAPCQFRGEALTGWERQRLGLSSANWAPCSHPSQPRGAYTCPCNGCLPSCDGYSPREDDATESDAGDG